MQYLDNLAIIITILIALFPLRVQHFHIKLLNHVSMVPFGPNSLMRIYRAQYAYYLPRKA